MSLEKVGPQKSERSLDKAPKSQKNQSEYGCFWRLFSGFLRATTKGQNRFIILGTFWHFLALFQNFSPRTFPFKTKGLAQGRQKRRKDNKKKRANRFCTLLHVCPPIFGPFSRLFSDFWGPTPSRLFSRLSGFWPQDSLSQIHRTSSLGS